LPTGRSEDSDTRTPDTFFASNWQVALLIDWRLTDVGIATWYVVVGLFRLESHADSLLDVQGFGGVRGRDSTADVLAGVGQGVEGSDGIADHGFEVEGAWGAIEGPEGLGAVCVEGEEVVDLALGDACGDAIEGPDEGEVVEPRLLQACAQVGEG
jgi:hypothetical protein